MRATSSSASPSASNPTDGSMSTNISTPIKLVDLFGAGGSSSAVGTRTSSPRIPAEITLLWPPCVPTQQPCVIEVQMMPMGVTMSATYHSTAAAAPQVHTLSPGPTNSSTSSCDTTLSDSSSQANSFEKGSSASDGSLAMHAMVGSAASSRAPTAPFSLPHGRAPQHTAHLLTVARDNVVAVEHVALMGRRSCSSRIRIFERGATVLSFVMGDDKGLPSYEAIKDAALLPILPLQACQEMQRLLWSMMHECLPPDVAPPPFDQEAFSSPLSSLPTFLQQAASWAWGSHFRHLAADLSYCLDCAPESGTQQEQDFRAVLCSIVAYLRDHDAWATLACLLASCTARGCVLLSGHAACPLSPTDLLPESVAAMSGPPACLRCPGTGSPCSCMFSPPPSPCTRSPKMPLGSSHPSLGSYSSLYSPSSTPSYRRCQASVLPKTSLAAFARRLAGFPDAAKGQGSANLCLATYLRTTCDGRGMWLGTIKRSKEGKGALLKVSIGGQASLAWGIHFVGVMMVMVMAWVAFVLLALRAVGIILLPFEEKL